MQLPDLLDDELGEEIIEDDKGMKYIINRNSGVSDKLLNLTLDFLKNRGIRHFGKAGAGLSNQLVDPKYKDYPIQANLVQAGIEGEKATSQKLLEWSSKNPSVIVVDSIALKLAKEDEQAEMDEGEEGKLDNLADTDHIVIVGKSVYIIDSKNWKGRASYTVTEEKEILRTKAAFQGSNPRIDACKFFWKKYLGDAVQSIRTYICIANGTPIIVRDRNWWKAGWKLVNHDTLVYFLARDVRYDNGASGILSDLTVEDSVVETVDYVDFIQVDLVAKVIAGIQKPYNKLKEEHPDVYKRMMTGINTR